MKKLFFILLVTYYIVFVTSKPSAMHIGKNADEVSFASHKTSNKS